MNDDQAKMLTAALLTVTVAIQRGDTNVELAEGGTVEGVMKQYKAFRDKLDES